MLKILTTKFIFYEKSY